MKYQNQRPDLADQIKTLVQSANSVKTVPHGIKTVNPGEGLQLLSGDGAEIFWDWETAAEYDTRISEGRAAIEQARLDLDQAEADLAAAAARLDENERILDALGPRVDAAESTVAQASKDLTAVSGRLDTTAKDLTTLQGTVGDVQSAVLESDRKAAAAQTAADQASSAAGSAASKATAAQTTADQAKTAAGTADEAARAASGLAATKGEVIYQASAPTGARAVAQNLWIRTTDNKPHTWNGTTWVAVTDKAATDAAAAAASAQTAASTAQTTADQAKADAAAAAKNAMDAMTRAGQAQTSADGKNTITRSTSPAAQPGKAVGDTHFTMSSMGGGGVVTRQQRWDGSTWQDESLSHQVIASLDLGKATVGELEGSRIKARTIGVDQLTVGLAGNLIVDPNFNDPQVSAWRLAGRWSLGALSDGTTYFTATSNGTSTDMGLNGGQSNGPSIPVTAGMSYTLSLEYSGPLHVYLGIRYANGNVGTPGASLQYLARTDRGVDSITITPDNYPIGAGATVKPVQIAVKLRAPGSAAVGTETRVYSAKLAPKVGTVLIEDGAITGDKVDAQTVAAKVGQFVKVQAANVEVTGDLAARVVNAMTAQAKNLVVTESAVLQHTTLLGTTVADQLNVRKLLRGRDAILTGTVDVAQLNVTEAMSAEIVNAMSVAAKKLVVTEDAILNRATVVQSLVTPELIADKANVDTLGARLVSAGALVSKDSTGSVQITPGGITAQDATPGGTYTRRVQLTPAGLVGGTRTTQTVRIDGENNFITGSFATAAKEQRVEIKSGGSSASADFFGSGTTVDHLGVWHNSDGGSTAASRLISQNGMTRIRANPGMIMWPMRGDFAFTGRWARNSDTLKMFSLVNYSGIPGGAWVDLKFTYPVAFPTTYSELIPVMSVESRSGAECTINTRTNDADSITFRVVNKSTNATDVLYVRGFTLNFNTVTYSDMY